MLTAEHLGGDVQQREGRFIYHIRMNREGLITVEDDSLFILVPIGMTPQQ